MKVGILGSGQLARLMITENSGLGYQFNVLDRQDTANVSKLCQLIKDDGTSREMLLSLCETCDVVTFENENISSEILMLLSQQFPQKIHPKPNIISQFNDRIKEKDFFRFLRIPTNQYRALYSKEHAISVAKELTFPLVLKQRTNTYDGKGQKIIDNLDTLKAINDYPFSNAILEEYVAFDNEIALTACRDLHGETVFYDMSYNIADKGILRISQNVKDHPMLNKAKNYLQRLVSSLDYVGACTMEFFQKGDELVANEFSPRVHNSAHWTIDATNCNQFENHLRAITGQKVIAPTSFTEATMINVISCHPNTTIPSFIHYYDYQKEPKINRKLGHMTILRSQFKTNHDYLNAIDYLSKTINKTISNYQRVAL